MNGGSTNVRVRSDRGLAEFDLPRESSGTTRECPKRRDFPPPPGTSSAASPVLKRMRRRSTVTILLALSISIGVPSFSGAEQTSGRGPFLLVSLASLGVVTWRCDPAQQPSLALGFRTFTNSADSYVTLRAAGGTIVKRHLLPGAAVRFPYVKPERQQLEIVQGTEAGTLNAYVSVDFTATSGPSHCWSYSPPATTVRMTTRR
jgi:hypothetical protein